MLCEEPRGGCPGGVSRTDDKNDLENEALIRMKDEPALNTTIHLTQHSGCTSLIIHCNPKQGISSGANSTNMRKVV